MENEEEEGPVADEGVYNYIEEWRESRKSGKDFERQENLKVVSTAHQFNKESWSSVLLYSSVVDFSTRWTDVTLEDFDIILQLGKGAFGKVYLSKFKENGEYYAIKSIRKDVLIETD
jgi:hypothetical protein